MSEPISSRVRRREEADRAYELQAKAATWGAARYTVYGTGLAVFGHYTWPLFRRQTLAFKAFLVSGFTIFGLVVGADTALLSHEADKRASEAALRREARLDLARRGIVGTETEIAKWKDERAKSRSSNNNDDKTQE